MHTLIFLLIVFVTASLIAVPLWLGHRRRAQSDAATRESAADPGADPEPPAQT